MLIKFNDKNEYLFPGQDMPFNKIFPSNFVISYLDDISGKKYILEKDKELTIEFENDEVVCINSSKNYFIENVFLRNKVLVKAGTYFLKDQPGLLVIKKDASKSLAITITVFRRINQDQIQNLIELYKHLDNIKWQVPALSTILLGGFFSYFGVQLTSVESYPSPALMAFLSFFGSILFFILALSIGRISEGHSRLHFFIAAQSDYHYFTSHPYFNRYFKKSFIDHCGRMKFSCFMISSTKCFELFLYMLFMMSFFYSISLLFCNGKFKEPSTWNDTIYCWIRNSVNPSPSSIGPAVVQNRLIIFPDTVKVKEYCDL